MQKVVVVRTLLDDPRGHCWSQEVDPVIGLESVTGQCRAHAALSSNASSSTGRPLRQLLEQGWRVVRACPLSSSLEAGCLLILEAPSPEPASTQAQAQAPVQANRMPATPTSSSGKPEAKKDASTPWPQPSPTKQSDPKPASCPTPKTATQTPRNSPTSGPVELHFGDTTPTIAVLPFTRPHSTQMPKEQPSPTLSNSTRTNPSPTAASQPTAPRPATGNANTGISAFADPIGSASTKTNQTEALPSQSPLEVEWAEHIEVYRAIHRTLHEMLATLETHHTLPAASNTPNLTGLGAVDQQFGAIPWKNPLDEPVRSQQEWDGETVPLEVFRIRKPRLA